MNELRRQYLETLKASTGKQLVSKSASGPRIYAVKNNQGDIIGFRTGEPVSPDEVRRVVSKSASASEDPNAILDSFVLPTPKDGLQSFGQLQDVSKSAETEDDDLINIFPACLR